MKIFEIIYRVTDYDNKVTVIYASNILQAIESVRSYCSIHDIVSVKEL